MLLCRGAYLCLIKFTECTICSFPGCCIQPRRVSRNRWLRFFVHDLLFFKKDKKVTLVKTAFKAAHQRLHKDARRNNDRDTPQSANRTGFLENTLVGAQELVVICLFSCAFVTLMQSGCSSNRCWLTLPPAPTTFYLHWKCSLEWSHGFTIQTRGKRCYLLDQ